MPSLNEAITKRIEVASGQYYRLVLVVGPSGSGKTTALKNIAAENAYPFINVNLSLSEKLLEIAKKARALQVLRVLQDMLSAVESGVVLLDNTEVLFDPSLQQDPLRCLQSLSRNKTVVATWNGRLKDGILSYAEHDHPEYQQYAQVDAIVVRTS